LQELFAMPRKTRCPRHAFTLIEVLLVILIIAMLAAILMPVLAHAKTESLKTVAVSNARQLGQAHMMYSGDYDDMFAPYFSGYDPVTKTYNSPQKYWQELICPYIQPVRGTGWLGQAIADDLPKIFFDPMKRFKSQTNDSFQHGVVSSWGVTDDIVDWFAPTGQTPSKLPIPRSRVADPSGCLHLVETYDWLLGSGYPGSAISLSIFDEGGAGAQMSLDAPYEGHARQSVSDPLDPRGGNVCLFCDGHAAVTKAGRLLATPAMWSVGADGKWR
jgi:prepilin-type N-terminal cleavage/methylation domain-containing protein